MKFSDAALSSLPSHEQEIVRRHLGGKAGAGDAGDAVRTASEAALAKKRQCEARRWRLSFRGRDVVLREEADKLVRFIEKFASVGDVVANADPVHIGLPWAGIRMLLEVAVSGSRQMAALLAGMNLGMYMVDRLQAYFAYRRRLPDTPTTATFEKALVKMYAMVLGFFDEAIDAYKSSSATRAWKAVWAESELDKFDGECRDWAVQVEIDASNCDRELSEKEREDTKRWREATLTAGLERVTETVTKALEIRQTTKQKEIVDWLAPPDPFLTHYAACEKREPGTGSWLLQSLQYEEWRVSEGTMLWLTGKAGCGKTVLCSTVIEDVRRDAAGARFAIFYFSFSDVQRQSYVGMLSSLVAQLLHDRPELDKLHNKFFPNKPSSEALEEILSVYFQQNETILALDGLDELPEHDDGGRPTVLAWLGRAMKSGRLRVFVTSRQLPDIEMSMTSLGARCVLLHPEFANDDIQKYVATELEKHHKLRLFKPELKDKIREVFGQKSDGMFRWAFCQLEALKNLKSTKPKYVEEALRGLPRSLDATYERMLVQIDEMYHEEAVTALRWLTFTTRPLALDELAEACLIDCDNRQQFVDVENRGPSSDIVEILAGLVIVDDAVEEDDGEQRRFYPFKSGKRDSEKQPASPSRVIRLAHFSVKEFLVSRRIAASSATKFALGDPDCQVLFKSCIAYLLYYSVSQKTGAAGDLKDFPFLLYAAREWPSLMLDTKSPPSELVLELLQSDEHKKNWLAIHQPDNLVPEAFEPRDYQVGSALYYTSLAGHLTASRILLDQGADANLQGGFWGNPLQAASSRGHLEVVKLLIERGADVNARGGALGGCLHAAAGRGDREVVNLLLDRGADIDAVKGTFGSPLRIACWNDRWDIVKLLLNRGAAYMGSWNPPYVTMADEQLEVLQLFHDAGWKAPPEAIYAAVTSARPSQKLVNLLISNGADVNRVGAKGVAALRASVSRGDREMVELLLAHGAKVNAQDEYSTALHAAVLEGHTDIVRRLLNHQADVTLRDNHDWTPWMIASASGHREIIELLSPHLKDEAKTGCSSGLAPAAMMKMTAERNPDAITPDGLTVIGRNQTPYHIRHAHTD